MQGFAETVRELGIKNAVILAVLAYLAKDVVPWIGARLVEVGKWLAPRLDRVLDRALDDGRRPGPSTPTEEVSNHEQAKG